MKRAHRDAELDRSRVAGAGGSKPRRGRFKRDALPPGRAPLRESGSGDAAPSPAASGADELVLERLQEILARLVCERQELRRVGVDRNTLERNRLEIVARQQQLSRALLARFCPSA